MSSPALILAGGSSTELFIGSVLATLTSEKTKQAYAAALAEFLAWMTTRDEPLSKPLLESWRGSLLARGLSVSSINQRLSAVRLLLRQAADCGALPMEEALRLSSVTNIKQTGQRLGKWLTEKDAGRLLSVPDPHTRLGIRDRALLALLVACGLRRDELVHLEVRHLQLRDDRWVLLDIQGKGDAGAPCPSRSGSNSSSITGSATAGSWKDHCFGRCARVEPSARPNR
jgi:site-specific recombinase XerD